MRCGACTAACPTSSLERSFLPDPELRELIVDSVRPDRPLLIVGEHHRELIERAHSNRWGVVGLRSVLILDASALLTGHLSGASAIVVAGCRECHQESLDVVAAAAVVADALMDRSVSTLVYDVADPRLVAALTERSAPDQPISARSVIGRQDLPPAALAHREALGHLVLLAGGPHESGPDVVLGGVGRPGVDDTACTLCGACARTCPTSALLVEASNDGRSTVLSARDVDCVDCGMCAAACPEAAITVGVARSQTLIERRTLVSDLVVPCSVCAEPHLPKRLLDHARAVVGSSGRPPTHASRQLDRCPTCRDVGTDGLRARPVDPDVPAPIGVPQIDRRAFIGAGAASVGGVLGMIAAGTLGAEPVAAQNNDPDVTPGRLGMVIDLRTCIGCHACSAVCKAENHVPLGVYRDWVEEYTLGEYPDARPVFLPKLCNHCDDPGCMRACPTGAIYRRVDGIVDLDHDMC
ncbi:MAG: 4Fe-4S dicluster domain-containing protein, partial [Microthrixaceae bacterium]